MAADASITVFPGLSCILHVVARGIWHAVRCSSSGAAEDGGAGLVAAVAGCVVDDLAAAHSGMDFSPIRQGMVVVA